jgi:hypothetical protein
MLDGRLDVCSHDDTDCQLVSGTALRRKAAGESEKEHEVWHVSAASSASPAL